ncbi:hypothetical protein ACFWBB_10535 [Streptomyces sp. NPDC060000]|uniref:hypothetical protein n=1 Tax=Streptomyces sp. NPDC060000 TaxID=3347031 RepID=UPI00368E9F08
MNQSANVHLQTLENHRASYQTMTGLAQQAEQGWQGQAGVNFTNALNAWLENYKVVGNVLDQMHERIVANGQQLSTTHESTTGTTAQVGATMAQPVGLVGF